MASYIDVAGASFREFMDGRLHNVAGAVATVGDFADHVTTVFTDVRIKRFLEMRGADAGRADMMVAQSAFWVGLLYDDAALAAAEALLRGAGWEDAVALRAAVPREGLAAAVARRHPARPGARRGRHRPRRPARPRAARRGRRRTKRSTSNRWRPSPPASRPRQNIGWRDSIRHGRVMSQRIFAEAAI